MRVVYAFVAFVMVLLFAGCGEENKGGASKIHWDRDMCDRCAMVLSDRKNSTQLRDPHTNRVRKFDDIGCMVLWFDEEGVEYKDSVKIYTTDAKSGEWIDARSAFYTTQNITPMAFGFSSYESRDGLEGEVIDYDEVYKRVLQSQK